MDMGRPSGLQTPARLWRFGAACFDDTARTLFVGGSEIEIEIERRPLDLLALLLDHAGIGGPEYKTILTNTGLMLSAMDHAHATGGGILSISLASLTDAVYAAFGDDEGGTTVTAGPDQLSGNLVLDSRGNVWGASNSYIDPAYPNNAAPPVVFEITP